MSKTRFAFGLSFVERILGIILIFIGATLTYYSYTNQPATVLSFPYFVAAGIIIVILGIILFFARTG